MRKKLLKAICFLIVGASVSNVVEAQISGLLQRFTFNNTYANTNTTSPVSFNSNFGTSFVQDRNGNNTSALQITNTGTTALIGGLPGGSGARTVSLWVKINAFNMQGFNFLFNYGATGTSAYGAVLNQTSITNFGSPTNPTSHSQPITNVLNQWDHFVFTFENTTTVNNISKIYKNGVLVGVKQLFVNTLNSNAGFRLGLTEAGGPNYFSGVVDDLEIYNRALTADEVFQLYGLTSTPAVAWNFNVSTTANGGLYAFSTPIGTGLNFDRFNNASSALYMNNSGSVATGVTPLPTGNAARTVSFWFKRSQSDFQELFVYGSSGAGSCFGLYVTANGSFVNYYTNNGSVYAAMSGSSDQPIAPDTWHFMTVVYTQDSSNIYRNGVPIARFSNSVVLTTTGTNLRLGMVLTTSQNPFQGTIDEIKVYSGALSPAEIAASYNASLPTHLNNFTVQLKNQTAQLLWDTKTEINTSHFDVEYSNDAKEYKHVGKLNAAGNSNTTMRYNYNHTVNNEATHYYRLKMVDKDDKYSYSNVVKLNNGRSNIKAEVYPTIASNTIQVNITAKESSNATIQIINTNGNIVQQQSILLQPGTQNKLVDISTLMKGTYFILLNNNNTVERFTIIKM